MARYGAFGGSGLSHDQLHGAVDARVLARTENRRGRETGIHEPIQRRKCRLLRRPADADADADAEEQWRPRGTDILIPEVRS